MTKRKTLWILILLTIFMGGYNVFAQIQIKVKIKATPLQKDQPIFIALDYNNWEPGDIKYKLNKDNDSTYKITLTNTPSVFEYKFTQGSWLFVEGTPEGESLPNRTFNLNTQSTNQIEANILGWEKIISYDIFVKSLPENTPKDAKISITGNFNNWELGDPIYDLKKSPSGTFHVKIYSDLERIEYKFTRGSWESVESRESGKARPNRVIFRETVKDNNEINVNIDGWEDLLGSLHVYSLFDFLLLFSVFQGILLIIVLPTLQSTNKDANRWLIFSILIASCGVLCYIMGNFQIFVNRYPRLVVLPDLVYFLFGPIFYFYLLKLLYHVKFLPSRWYLHFIPFLIQFFVYLPFLLQNNRTFLLDLMNQKQELMIIFGGSGILGLLWNIYYWNLFRRTLKTYNTEFQSKLSYEQNLSYLNGVLIVMFITICVWGFTLLLMFLQNVMGFENTLIIENSVDFTWLMFSCIVYFVGYFAIQQSETFKVNPRQISIFDDPMDASLSSTTKVPEEENHDDMLEEIQKLEAYIESEKPYTNPKITLSELAHQLDLSTHTLSKIINDHYQQNFFDFINHYRVKEFQLLIQSPKHANLTFLALAFEVGFNSKTSFNRAFKKITNQTPREYLESFNNPKK